MDSRNTCEPLQENYVLSLHTESFTYTCSSSNTECEMQACLCDLELINSLLEKAENHNYYFEPSYGFNPHESCVSGEYGNFPVDECCGDYPS